MIWFNLLINANSVCRVCMRCCGVMSFYFCETPILFPFTAIEYFFVFHCYVMVFLSYEMEFHLYFMVIHFYFVMFHFYDTLREWEYFLRLRLQPFWDVWFLFVLDESNTPFRKCQTLAPRYWRILHSLYVIYNLKQ